MKRIVIVVLMMTSILNTYSKESFVSGVITLEEKNEKKNDIKKGALFVILRKQGVKRGPPVAVLKIDNPRFPTSFSISKKNIMIKGTEFVGPFWIKAKFVPDGNPLGEGQLLGELSPVDGVQSNSKNLKVILKKK